MSDAGPIVMSVPGGRCHDTRHKTQRHGEAKCAVDSSSCADVPPRECTEADIDLRPLNGVRSGFSHRRRKFCVLSSVLGCEGAKIRRSAAFGFEAPEVVSRSGFTGPRRQWFPPSAPVRPVPDQPSKSHEGHRPASRYCRSGCCRCRTATPTLSLVIAIVGMRSLVADGADRAKIAARQ